MPQMKHGPKDFPFPEPRDLPLLPLGDQEEEGDPAMHLPLFDSGAKYPRAARTFRTASRASVSVLVASLASA